MAGLDPETARWLAQLGIAATLIAALIALVSNLIGQGIQRATQLELDHRKARREYREQIELDHRKARREYREQIMAPIRAQASRRVGMVLAVQEAAKAGERDKADELTAQLHNADISGEMSFFGITEERLQEPLMRMGNWSEEAVNAVKARREDADLSPLVAELDRASGGTFGAVGDLNREIERYVLEFPRPWWRFWRR